MKRFLRFLIYCWIVVILSYFLFCMQTLTKQNKQQMENIKKMPVIVGEPIVYEESTKNVDEVIYELSEEEKYERAALALNADISAIQTANKLEWYMSYKEALEKYEDILDMPETIYDYYSCEEIYLIQRMVETECYQAGFEPKVAVANVAFNRLENGRFGEDINSIITSPKQFAYWRKDISEETVLAVEYAFQIEDLTDGSIGFHSNAKTNTFNGWEYVFTDKAGHHFYKIGE